MSQLSAPIEYIVQHILPNYSDAELSGMLAARTNKDSMLYRAIIQEMGERVAREGRLA
jgi:predicted transposase YdaD